MIDKTGAFKQEKKLPICNRNIWFIKHLEFSKFYFSLTGCLNLMILKVDWKGEVMYVTYKEATRKCKQGNIVTLLADKEEQLLPSQCRHTTSETISSLPYLDYRQQSLFGFLKSNCILMLLNKRSNDNIIYKSSHLHKFVLNKWKKDHIKLYINVPKIYFCALNTVFVNFIVRSC